MKNKLEKLAELEHEQWMQWAKAVIGEVSPERRERWNNFFIPYVYLSEEVKSLDRKWARKVMEIMDER